MFFSLESGLHIQIDGVSNANRGEGKGAVPVSVCVRFFLQCYSY